jgi:DNA-binding CsgD family transcriptional regulator
LAIGSDRTEGTHVLSEELRSLLENKLRGRDSNPDFTVQSRANFHYSTPQRRSRIASEEVMSRSRNHANEGGATTREQVRVLLSQGLTNSEAARRIGVSPAAVSFHARKLGIPPSTKYAPREDWDDIQRHYDAGYSVRECQERFGFSRRSWNKAVERGEIVPRPQAVPIEELLTANRLRSRTRVKLRLLSAGLKEERCEECGLTEWLGEPLSLALHHVNGDQADNRLENLQLLCANCHSQTPTYARKKTA